MTDPYWTLTVTLDAADPAPAEAVTNFLWEAGAVGVVETEAAPAADRVVAGFFPPGSDAADLRARVGEYLDALRRLAVPVGAGRVEVRPVPAEPWADAWRAHFRPLAVGRGWLVCPPWDVPAVPPPGPDGPRRVLVVEPGRAFGTGSHATTQGCLEILERAVEGAPAARPDRVVDVGTGSGILAVAAALLGVPRVEAIDVDPDAVAAARANADRNGIGDRVTVTLADLADWPGPPAPLVVANLLGATLVDRAAVLARGVTGDGRLIAGGLLVHEVPAVVGAFVPEGFHLVEVTEREGWATLLLSRGA